MQKSGFTLAEVLITLMILGIIAALTIPSLIQNTQKKEQVVQVKKALSMINQAITMNYALEQEDLASSDYDTVTEVVAMLKKRLAATDSGAAAVTTQDGLTYYLDATNRANCTSVMNEVNSSAKCFDLIVSTKNKTSDTPVLSTYPTVGSGTGNIQLSKAGTLTGYYGFYVGSDRVVPTADTASVIYAKDATKFDAGSNNDSDSDSDTDSDTDSE